MVFSIFRFVVNTVIFYHFKFGIAILIISWMKMSGRSKMIDLMLLGVFIGLISIIVYLHTQKPEVYTKVDT